MKYLTASERKQFARITGYEHQEERELLPHQHINPQTGLPDRARVGVPAMETPPPPSRIPRLPNLSEKERAVETQFAEAFLDDPDAFVDKYLKALAKGKVGVERNVFATDDVKMLNRDWNPGKVKVGEALDDETQKAMAKYNTAIHATANAIAKRAFLKYLDDVVKKLPEGKRSVLVTCGGCASGKGSSTARAADPNSPYAKMLPAAHHVGAVWDAAGEQNATENEWVLQECKRRGIKPIFAYIHADPKETWEAEDRGVIRRAIRKGRMVDARLFADSYAEGAKNMHAFHQRHKDDGTQFIFLDNRTKGEPKPLVGVPSEALEWDADDIYSDAVNTLQRRAADLPKALVKGGLNGMKIWGAPKPKKMLKAVMKAVRHAPAGGITIAGEFFRGGQFIPDDVYDKASEEEKAQLAEGKSDDDTPTAEAKPEPEPEEEPADEWDGTIEDSEVEVFDPEHDEEVTTYAQYDEDEGTKKEISVYVQKGLYTTPQGDEIEVYRWVEADESNPDEILNTGEWTEDLDEAKQEANEHADAEDQPMPELTDDMIKSDMIDNENYGHAIASYYHTPHGNEANVLLYTGTVELYGEEHDVYKWVAQDEEDDIIAEGEWTFNKDKAKADGKDHAYVEDVEQENDEEDYPSEFTPASDNKPNEDLPDETRPDIDDETAQYLNNYSWGYDGPMNAALRNTWEPPPGMFGGNREGKPDKDGPEMFAKMREAFADAPTFGPPPITVHRGIRELPNEIRDRLMAAAEHAMENGLTIAMGGFVSTATRSSASFDGPLKFQIDAIHGLDLKPYSHFPGERELLLNHGCQYRVKNVIRGREYHTIHLEQVTNGTEPPPPEMIALDGKERVLKAMKDNSNNNEDRRSQLDKRQDRFNADYDEARSWLKAFENGVKVEDTKEGTDNEKR
jgi:hypothetical protein